ncbi:MAG: rod shape-determining protein MreC [Candidatus Omnitrophota bacterium]
MLIRRWRSLGWLGGALLILLTGFQFPRIHQSVRNIFDSVSKPVLFAGSSVRNTASALRLNFGKFWDAVSKAREYQEQILDLQTRLLRYEEMDKENQRLRKLLDFSQALPYKTVGARVIGEDNTPWKRVVILDKGSNRGIRKDMVLVAPEGLLGRVLEVGPYTSRAIFLPDPQCRVSALTANGRVQGVISGTGSEILQMKYLPIDSEITIGEEIITSGIESLFPKGIQIGTVVSLEKDPDGLHLRAQVRPAASFSKIEELLCLISPASK